MAYTLITANRNYSSWSLRPWILMKMLELPFEDRIEPFRQDDNHAAFRQFSPTGQVPCLIDEGVTVWDSLGITLYLADRHDGIWPEDHAARAWAMCAVAEMHGGFGALRSDCPMSIGIRVLLNPMRPALLRDVARIVELWTEGLNRFGGPFLAGDRFTAVDAFYAPVAYRVRTYGLDVGPAGQAWVDRMLALPDMLAWEAAALSESWRETAHEDEVRDRGVITADLRTA
jgi:glutathione S-transferase